MVTSTPPTLSFAERDRRWAGVRELMRQQDLDGKLRALAVASNQRMPAADDIPTFAEVGLGDITATGWNGAEQGHYGQIIQNANIKLD